MHDCNEIVPVVEVGCHDSYDELKGILEEKRRLVSSLKEKIEVIKELEIERDNLSNLISNNELAPLRTSLVQQILSTRNDLDAALKELDKQRSRLEISNRVLNDFEACQKPCDSLTISSEVNPFTSLPEKITSEKIYNSAENAPDEDDDNFFSSNGLVGIFSSFCSELSKALH